MIGVRRLPVDVLLKTISGILWHGAIAGLAFGGRKGSGAIDDGK
jgi:hypothetical protein